MNYIKTDRVLKSKVGKAFVQLATNELFGRKPLDQCNWLNRECRGMFAEVISDTLPVTWVAFDNYGHEIFVEEFDDVREAHKYATGQIAKTRDGVLI